MDNDDRRAEERRRAAEEAAMKGNGTDAESAKNPLPPLAAQQRALADLDSLALHPRCVVQDYLYDDAGTLIAPGGTGKTTLLLYESIHIVLGLHLYGLKVVSPGPVIILTAEDPADVLYARLREIMSGLGLSDDQKHKVLASVYIADLCGMDLRLVCRQDGTIKPTVLADHIIERYGPVSPAVITIDPQVNFGAGEQQYSNDDAQALLTASRHIMRAIKCCVRYVHHTGIQNAREWRLDQYAGRGASATPDGCRMVAVMQPWSPATEVPLPPGVTCGPGENVMVLARPKGNYCPPQPHLWITRRGWSFSHTIEVPQDKEVEASARVDQVERFLIDQLKSDARHTKTDLEGAGILPDKKLRAALSSLLATGRVVYKPLPKEQRHGGRKDYLHPVAATPATGRKASAGVAQKAAPTPAEDPPVSTTPAPYRENSFAGVVGNAVSPQTRHPGNDACRGTAGVAGVEGGLAPGNGAAMAEIREWLQRLGEDPETIRDVLGACTRDPGVMVGYLRSARQVNE